VTAVDFLARMASSSPIDVRKALSDLPPCDNSSWTPWRAPRRDGPLLHLCVDSLAATTDAACVAVDREWAMLAEQVVEHLDQSVQPVLVALGIAGAAPAGLPALPLPAFVAGRGVGQALVAAARRAAAAPPAGCGSLGSTWPSPSGAAA
jgi:hypothetical protein